MSSSFEGLSSVKELSSSEAVSSSFDGTLQEGLYKSEVLILLQEQKSSSSGGNSPSIAGDEILLGPNSSGVALFDTIFIYKEIKIVGTDFTLSHYYKVLPEDPNFTSKFEVKGDWEVIGDTLTILDLQGRTKEDEAWSEWEEIKNEDFSRAIDVKTAKSFSLFGLGREEDIMLQEGGWILFTSDLE